MARTAQAIRLSYDVDCRNVRALAATSAAGVVGGLVACARQVMCTRTQHAAREMEVGCKTVLGALAASPNLR